MLKLNIEEQEFFNSDTEEFFTIPAGTLELEHSLLSVSKWEIETKRAFMSEKEGVKTPEDCKQYIKCMTLNRNVDPRIYDGISPAQIEEVMNYISDQKTATTFNEQKSRKRGRMAMSKVTNEVIYWQMCQWGIPKECEKWHLSRLLTLIRVCNEKGEPPQKMSNDALLRQYAGVNAKRRKPRKH